MQKKDLKSGMVVVARNGKRGLILLDTSCGDVIGGCGGDSSGFCFCTTVGPHDLIRNDLTHVRDKDYDIMKVYNSTSNYNFGSLDTDDLELIWKREPKIIELTIDEIAEKFNVPAGNIKIKKG